MPAMQEKIKKREAEAHQTGMAVAAAAAATVTDNFLTSNEQDQRDLAMSLTNKKEEMSRMEEEALLPSEVDFSEEGVALEMQRSMDNINTMREHVERQDFVYRAIMAKVSEDEDTPAERRKQERRAESRENKHAFSPYQVEESDSVRVQHACVVANELVRGQVKRADQVQRRANIAREEEKFVDSLRDKHERMDRKVELRRRQQVDKQVERTLTNQQRRNEQQKVLKELQRDQEHQFEMLQAKHHPGAVSGHKLDKHSQDEPDTPRAAQTLPAGDWAKMNRSASEPIYRDMCASHSIYNDTLERWRTFEADNEKRTEAYWQKMMRGDSRTPTKAEKAEKALQSRLSVFRSAAKNITNIGRFVKRASIMPGLPEGGSSYEDELEVQNSVRISEGGSWDGFGSGRATSSNDPGTHAPREQYQRRLQRVKTFHEDLDKQASDKARKDKEYLEEKIQRGKDYQNAKASKAGDGVKVWEQRSQASAENRARLAVQNEGESEVKMERAAARLDEMYADAHRARTDTASTKNQMQSSILAGANRFAEDKKEHFREAQSEMDARGAALLDVRMKMNAHRANNGYAEKVEQKLKQKHESDKDFRNKVAMEVKMKDERQEGVMARVGKQQQAPDVRDEKAVLARRRLIRKETGRDLARPPPPELTLPPDLALPPHLLLSPKSAGTPAAAQLGFGSLSSSGAGKVTSASSPNDMDELEKEMMDVIARQKVVNASSRKPSAGMKASQTPSSMVPSEANLGASAGGSSRRDEDEAEASEGEESEGEAQFLDDLRVKSGNWLKDLRHKADANPT